MFRIHLRYSSPRWTWNIVRWFVIHSWTRYWIRWCCQLVSSWWPRRREH